MVGGLAHHLEPGSATEVDVGARQSGQARILAHREEQGLAPPQSEPHGHGDAERRPQSDSDGASDGRGGAGIATEVSRQAWSLGQGWFTAPE